MMMFHSDITFVLGLVAFTMGLKLLFKAKKHNDIGTGAYKFWGWVICILAAITLFCAGYKSVTYTFHKYNNSNYQAMKKHMMKKLTKAQATRYVKRRR